MNRKNRTPFRREAAWLLLLCLVAVLVAPPTWAKKDKWGEVKPAEPAPVTAYAELRGRIVLPLVGEKILNKGAVPPNWTARLSDLSSQNELQTAVSATGSFVFSGVALMGPVTIRITDPDNHPWGLAAWRDKVEGDLDVTVDERSSIIVALLQAIIDRQAERPPAGEFEKPVHEKRMADLVRLYGEAVGNGSGIGDPAFRAAVDEFVNALLAPPPAPVVATPTTRTGAATETAAGALGPAGTLSPDGSPAGTLPAGGSGTATSVQTTIGTGASTGAGTDTGTPEQPAAASVALSQQVSYLKTVATQIRLSGLPADWNGTVVLPVMNGGTVTFSRSAALSGQGKTVLIFKGITIAILDHFSKLDFSEPLPSGTTVEVWDMDNDRAVASGNVP